MSWMGVGASVVVGDLRRVSPNTNDGNGE
jgi:hypothetical protein